MRARAAGEGEPRDVPAGPDLELTDPQPRGSDVSPVQTVVSARDVTR